MVNLPDRYDWWNQGDVAALESFIEDAMEMPTPCSDSAPEFWTPHIAEQLTEKQFQWLLAESEQPELASPFAGELGSPSDIFAELLAEYCERVNPPAVNRLIPLLEKAPGAAGIAMWVMAVVPDAVDYNIAWPALQPLLLPEGDLTKQQIFSRGTILCAVCRSRKELLQDPHVVSALKGFRSILVGERAEGVIEQIYELLNTD